MVIFPAVFIAVDVALALNRRDGDTYSEVMRRAGRRWLPLIMIVCFGFGLLAGHWWW